MVRKGKTGIEEEKSVAILLICVVSITAMYV